MVNNWTICIFVITIFSRASGYVVEPLEIFKDDAAKNYSSEDASMINNDEFSNSLDYFKENTIERDDDWRPRLNSLPQEFATSCGSLTCEKVDNYPEQLIAALYEKLDAKLKTRNYYPKLKTMNYYPELETWNYYSKKPRRKFLKPDFQYLLHKGRHTEPCAAHTIMKEPREAMNLYLKPVILVRVKGKVEPMSIECTAPKECNDHLTPEGHVQHCRDKIVWQKWLTLDENKIVMHEDLVSFADGCDCKLKRED